MMVEDFLKAENYAIQDRNNNFQKLEYFGGLGPIYLIRLGEFDYDQYINQPLSVNI